MGSFWYISTYYIVPLALPKCFLQQSQRKRFLSVKFRNQNPRVTDSREFESLFSNNDRPERLSLIFMKTEEDGFVLVYFDLIYSSLGVTKVFLASEPKKEVFER